MCVTFFLLFSTQYIVTNALTQTDSLPTIDDQNFELTMKEISSGRVELLLRWNYWDADLVYFFKSAETYTILQKNRFYFNSSAYNDTAFFDFRIF